MLETNKETARKFLECLGNADGDGLDSLLTEDCYADCTGTSIVSKIRDRDEMIRSCNYFKRTMKNGIRFDILNVTAEDDRVAIEAEGLSELQNGAAYNNQYHFLFFLRDGKIYKLREYLDTKLAEDVIRPMIESSRKK
jgi:ketosteroid isomerase-like protein